MDVRLFDADRDYAILCKWWEAWKWTPVPLMFLPKIGFIVSNKGQDVCAGFLYQSDSKMAMADWYISAKGIKKDVRKGCLDMLIDALCDAARSLGYLAVVSATRNESLTTKLESMGFIPEGGTVKHLTKVL